MNENICDCDGYDEETDTDCQGECCGIGNCVCTPVIAEAEAAMRGEDISTDALVDGILYGQTEVAREIRSWFGLEW